MKVIVGLGNPGEKYKNNRHNVGYLVIDKLKNQRTKEQKNLIVVKTDTFMNDSGEFVKKLVEQYEVSLSNLWVIHDDLDIELGDYKVQKGRGPKEHRGLLSIYEKLGTRDFWHVRIGVDNRDPGNRVLGEEYVLQDFTDQERKILDRVIMNLTKRLIA